MNRALSIGLRIGAVGIVANEIRGAVIAVPVIWGLYQSGGTLMAYWLAFCALGGIALSVVMPVMAARFLSKRWARPSGRRGSIRKSSIRAKG